MNPSDLEKAPARVSPVKKATAAILSAWALAPMGRFLRREKSEMKRWAFAAVVWPALVGGLRAELVQHLDATINASVTRNGSGVVSRWADQSVQHNDAVEGRGDVYYPGGSLSESGLAGLDYGLTRNDLILMDATKARSLLDFDGAAAGNEGFSVLVAFKIDQMPGTTQHIIGTKSTLNNFSIKLLADGTVALNLNNQLTASGSQKVAAGDTVVVGVTYRASTGNYQLWESRNNEIKAGTQDINADYGNGNDFRLGEAVTTASSSEYLRGMVGEVKIYNHALSSEDFTNQRNALAEKWAGIPAPVAVNWRVIPEDPLYPTEDVIVAAVSLDDSGFANPLPADPANEDCTATFQEALDVVDNAGGGTVFVPAGQYRLDGTLQVGGGVTLRGRWRPLTASQPAAGTIIKVYSGQGNASGTPVITGGGGSGVRDLTFWHPLQNPANITPYPFVLSGSQTIQNITFVNAYQGINFTNASMCHVNNIDGTVLHYGFYADLSAAISRFEKINFGPEFWEWAQLPDAAPVNPAYRSSMLANGTGIDIRDMDGFHLWDCHVRGMQTGLLFATSPVNGAGPSGGSITGLDIRDCVVAFNMTDKGGSLINSYLHGTDTAVLNDSGLACTNCTLTGGNAAVAGGGGVSAVLTTIDGVVDQSNGNVKLVGCNFTNTGTDVILGSSVDAVHIVGCQFADGPGIVDNAPGSIDKVINHHPVYGYSSPPVLPPKNLAIVRKPYNTTLFDITDYGATPDGGGDDSTAFGAAISAANANGGGIVFVPNGIFDVAGSYTLGPGVELRGTRGSLRGADSSNPGSLVQIRGNEGNPNGPAFLNLSADCGVRGMAFHYKSQRADMLYPETIIAYPFTIRATGGNIYISEIFMTNPYQGIHFYRADNHLLEHCNLGGLNNTIRVEECNNGRIGKFHVKPDFWKNSGFVDAPVGNGDDIDWYAGRHLRTLWLKNTTNEMVYSIFNHTAQNFMRVDNASGLADKTGGEVLQDGFRFSGNRDFSVVSGDILHDNWGDGAGMHGLWLENTFNGTVSVWQLGIAGTPGKAFYVQSGTLNATKVDYPGWAQRGNEILQVDAAGVLNFHMTGFAVRSGLLGCVLGTGSKVTVQDVSGAIPNRLLHHPGASLARDVYHQTYISTSTGSGQIVNDGLVLDPANLSIEDSPLTDGLYKIIKGARTANGNFTLDVVDADFTNGQSRNVDIKTYYKIDTDCTIEIYYDSSSGRKLGKSQTFVAASSDYESVDFSVTDAQFDGTDDIVIKIIGASPLLNYVNVFRDVTPAVNFPPLKPEGLVATAGDGQISLDWADNSEADLAGYRVYRSTISGGYTAPLATGVATSNYTDITAVNGNTYFYVVTAWDDDNLESGRSEEVGITTQPPPYHSPRALPGRIEAEDYNLGGEGIAYHDTTAGNSFGQYRTDDVDIEVATDGGSGFNIGAIAAGEWLDYTVNVPATGAYNIDFRLAAKGGGGTCHLEGGGVNLTGPVKSGDTGGWQNWVTRTISNVTLQEGEQILRLHFDTRGFNVNWMKFAAAGVIDNDGDGMDDLWEVAHFGGAGFKDGGEDTDGDRVPDFYEYLYDSDPNVAEPSGFRIWTAPHPDGISIEWTVAEGRVLDRDYVLLITGDLLTGSWRQALPVEYAAQTTTADGKTTVTFTLHDQSAPRMFFTIGQPQSP